ncbi:MAG: glycosyltransferase family 9 protein [Planctomycetes bacterium]|nr:glycosyltransferase family 9 protein [Planctomycetota bacterium]
MIPVADLRGILLIRLSAIGDVVNTLPSVTALREALPRVRIGFVVEERCRDVVLGHPCIDRVHVYSRRTWQRDCARPWRWRRLGSEVKSYLADIRAGAYDVAIDFQGNLKGGLHSWLSQIPVRIGFARGHCYELNWMFSTVPVIPPAERINRVEKFLSLLGPLGVFPSRPRYTLPPSDDSRRRVDTFLEEAGWARGDYAVVHPGTSEFGRKKRWPLERFSVLARRIAAGGRRVVVAWGPGERAMAEAIARVGGPGVRVALETRSLLDLAELIRGARLFVGADSGPLHLASAVSVPSVALFGPKDPVIYGPYNPRSRVVFKPNGRGFGSMEAITVDDAYAAVKAAESA